MPRLDWKVRCDISRGRGHTTLDSGGNPATVLLPNLTRESLFSLFSLSVSRALSLSHALSLLCLSHGKLERKKDVGGQEKIRPLWRHYFTGTQGLIFVVDANDRERLPEAREELHKIAMDREMRDAVILIFSNKMDLPNALSPAEVTDQLALHKLKNRNWYVQPSCAVTGDGLIAGLTWLSSAFKSK